MLRIDLNADVGESYGPWSLGQDPALMPLVTSANIACGFHAGDPGVMRQTVTLARQHDVSIGAHPGFPDLVGFGRRELRATAQEVEDMVVYQVAALAGVAAAQGSRLRHVKPHGALYNMASRDITLAEAIVRAVAAVDRSLAIYGLVGSAVLDAARREGLTIAAEVFADRAYQSNGFLVPRHERGAIIHDPALVANRVVQMVQTGTVEAIDGSRVTLEVDTVCVHGDNPEAVEVARAIRAALADAEIRVAPFGS